MLDCHSSSFYAYDFSEYSATKDEEKRALLTTVFQETSHQRLTIKNFSLITKKNLIDLANHSPNLLELELLCCGSDTEDKHWIEGLIEIAKRSHNLQRLILNGSIFSTLSYQQNFLGKYKSISMPNLTELSVKESPILKRICIDAPHLEILNIEATPSLLYLSTNSSNLEIVKQEKWYENILKVALDEQDNIRELQYQHHYSAPALVARYLNGDDFINYWKTLSITPEWQKKLACMQVSGEWTLAHLAALNLDEAAFLEFWSSLDRHPDLQRDLAQSKSWNGRTLAHEVLENLHSFTFLIFWKTLDCYPDTQHHLLQICESENSTPDYKIKCYLEESAISDICGNFINLPKVQKKRG